MIKKVQALVAPYLEGLGAEPTVILCSVSAMLLISHYQGSVGYAHTALGSTFDKHPANAAVGHFWWFGMAVVLYMLVPLIIARVFRGSFHDRYGLGLGDWKVGLTISALFLAVMLPVTWVASLTDTFKGQYPLAGAAAYTLNVDGKNVVSWKLFAAYEAAYVAYFVAWEFLFRGYMVIGLEKYWGRAAAILVQVAPFAVMHAGKAEPEALGSIIAGIALAILALRTRSFWYGVMIHGAVAVWMDWLSSKSALLG